MNVDELRSSGSGVPGSPGYRPTRVSHRSELQTLNSLGRRSNGTPWQQFIWGMWFVGPLYVVALVASTCPYWQPAMWKHAASDPTGYAASLLIAVAGMVISLVIASVPVFLGSLLAAGVVRSVGLVVNARATWTSVFAFTGSLTAYLVTLPVALVTAGEVCNETDGTRVFGLSLGSLGIVWLLGPGLAYLLGQAVGARIGIAADTFQRYRERGQRGVQVSAYDRRTRINLRQLLGLAVVASIVLAVAKAVDLLAPVLLATTTWLAVAFLGTWLTPAVARWSLRHLRCRPRPRSRSAAATPEGVI